MYSYDVYWEESHIAWSSRWDAYLKMPGGRVRPASCAPYCHSLPSNHISPVLLQKNFSALQLGMGARMTIWDQEMPLFIYDTISLVLYAV